MYQQTKKLRKKKERIEARKGEKEENNCKVILHGNRNALKVIGELFYSMST